LFTLRLAAATAAAATQHSAEITVTAARTPARLADTPASVVVISREALATSGALAVDDALRQVPGFTLFRRSGSRSANPTSQGVSLRGIGASGASRALVLDDGVPLNDPFGGWVYWSRIPRAAIERVEVVRGGASDLYGNAAMGGVIQFLRRAPARAFVFDGSLGSHDTRDASIYAAGEMGPWRGSLAGGYLSSGGYVLVDRAQRGIVDRKASARHGSVDATVERSVRGDGRVFMRLSRFSESRNNGTALQVNDTALRQIAIGADVGAVTIRAYDTRERYHQTFSAVSADRGTERLTNDQRTPSHGTGASAQYTHRAGTRSLLVAGIEERSVSSGAAKQRITSAFVEDSVILAARATVTAGVRYDSWRDSAWSPRVSALYRASDRLAFTASAYRAFRAPTLNELIRPFRVGNVLTLANENLRPERLSAVEAGVRAGPVRVTLFSMKTDDVISNVTRSVTPALITRQRDNQGFSRSRGIEIEGDVRIRNDWRASAGYLFADAVLDTAKRTPQVPRHQATLQLSYRGAAGVQARWGGLQFDDDLNQFRLRSYFVADAFASRPIARGVEATLGIENIFDRRIETAATPVITLAQPRSVRVGVRYGF
jgi:outer membrane receptor protein involved in Fe transport